MDGTISNDVPTDNDKDFHETNVLTHRVISIILVVNVGNLSYRRHAVLFPLDIPICNLKEVVEIMVKISNGSQAWFYKNRELENCETLHSIGMKKDAIIEVKRVLT